MNFEFNPNEITGEVKAPQVAAVVTPADNSWHAMAQVTANSVDWFAVGKSLRREAEKFVMWMNFGGSPAQQEIYAHDWRIRMRAQAAQLKSDIAEEGGNVAETLDVIFSKKHQVYPFTESTTLEARKELGI